ncbi:MAG: bifunctional metallophosphatase/5'-nucleotidase [Bacteroidales bacterium]|nr:bifunctional metallophosphatase/5'-nucleotidase [Bacteroidales bacterium]
MNKRFSIRILKIICFSLLITSCETNKDQSITILATTDLHGVILPYDFIEKEKTKVSLAHSASYIDKVRNTTKNVVLLDNGDNLQGQPIVYFYNFIDTVSTHINAEVMNYLGYDAVTVGNHDIEAGHNVYDRLRKEYEFPMLAANAVDISTGKPWFTPYTIINRGGYKIAVLGLITPAVPNWLPPELYSGIEFWDMVETARLWMPIIEKKHPDLIVGLFHSGWDARENGRDKDDYDENGTASVAWEVPGFDIIIAGHDHKVVNEKFINSAGDTVLILDGGSRSEKIVRADITFSNDRAGGSMRKILKGKIIDVDKYETAPGFMKKFGDIRNVIDTYVNKVIAKSEKSITSRDAYFGSSPFVDMIHTIQLQVTDADISFAAPLSFDVSIPAGKITVGDMFKLYRFENMLYTMSMTGDEIRKYLEYSYSGWYNTMKGPRDNILRFRTDKDGKPVLTNGVAWLKNQPYNFDSAAGIEYTVDVSKPEGSRISISSFSDGRPFVPEKTYTVAVNSYRGNGGGGHFYNGAGIGRRDLQNRLIRSTEKDLRYYIIEYLENIKTINPEAMGNWKVIPVEWASAASSMDYRLLFGK